MTGDRNLHQSATNGHAVDQWPGLAAVGKVERIREIAGKTTSDTAYYLLSAVLTPERFNKVVRSHWRVEIWLLWRLDVVLNEDQD